MKTRIQRWLGDDRLIFIVVSLVFAVILYFARLGGDDLVNIRLTRDVPAAEIWSRAWEMYFTWASRFPFLGSLSGLISMTLIEDKSIYFISCFAAFISCSFIFSGSSNFGLVPLFFALFIDSFLLKY